MLDRDAADSDIAERLKEYGYRILKDAGIENVHLNVFFSEDIPLIKGQIGYDTPRTMLRKMKAVEDNYNDLKQWRQEVDRLKEDERYKEIREDLSRSMKKLDKTLDMFGPYFELCEDGRYRVFEQVEDDMPDMVKVIMNSEYNKIEAEPIKIFTHEVFHYVIAKKMPRYNTIMAALRMPAKMLKRIHPRVASVVATTSAILSGATAYMYFSGNLPFIAPIGFALFVGLLTGPAKFDEKLTDYAAEQYLAEVGKLLDSPSEQA